MLRLKKIEVLYLSSLFLITFCKGIGMSSSDNLYKGIVLITFLSVLMKSLGDSWKRKELLLIVLLVTLLVINFFITKEEAPLFSAILLIGIKGIQINKLMLTMLISRSLGFGYNIILTSLGVLPNKILSFALFIPSVIWRKIRFSD